MKQTSSTAAHAAACPTHVIVSGDGGFPRIDFAAGGCTFCGACVSTCADGALRKSSEPPWSFKAVIGAACLAERRVECRVCAEQCEAGAIRFRLRAGGVAAPQLDQNACTGCGACIRPCPVNAIGMKRGADVSAMTACLEKEDAL